MTAKPPGKRLILADTTKVPEGKSVEKLMIEKLKERGLKLKDDRDSER